VSPNQLSDDDEFAQDVIGLVRVVMNLTSTILKNQETKKKPFVWTFRIPGALDV
jgi:hypothetical protein